MKLQDILPKLSEVKSLANGEYIALCPAHNDKNPSLTLKQANDRVLLDCKAGCQPEIVVAALGLTMADLFSDSMSSTPQIIATYDYTDEEGNFLFQVIRYQPKSFRQRRKDSSGEWVWNLDNTRRVLWKLPEILSCPDTIYLVEGEKDALEVWNYGRVATTSPGGSNAWKAEYANSLIGKRVVVIPDKDEAGFTFARQVVKSLQGKAREIKCIILPGDNVKDFSDWVIGRDKDDLEMLEQDIAVLFNPELPHYEMEKEQIAWHKKVGTQTLSFSGSEIRQERTGTHAKIIISSDYHILAWSILNIERAEDRTRLSNQASTGLKIKDYTKDKLRRDLDLFCSGLWTFYLSAFMPQFISGDPSPKPTHFYLFPYIVDGSGTILFAPPGRGKSHSALLWAQSINMGISTFWKVNKTQVLYINLERSAKSVKTRLANINKLLGLPVTQPLLMLNAKGKTLAEVAPLIRKSVQQHNTQLIILDSISRAGLGDLTENKPVNAIIDTLNGLCDSWLALGHTPRASEEHIFGGIHFEAGADIVIQLKSQISNNGTLGLGYEIVKANDLPHYNQEIFAFEFTDSGLSGVRKATPVEFSDIEAKKRTGMLDAIIDFVCNQDTGDASATEIEKELGFNRVNISQALNQSSKFVKTRKDGHSQYFGVKQV